MQNGRFQHCRRSDSSRKSQSESVAGRFPYVPRCPKCRRLSRRPFARSATVSPSTMLPPQRTCCVDAKNRRCIKMCMLLLLCRRSCKQCTQSGWREKNERYGQCFRRGDTSNALSLALVSDSYALAFPEKRSDEIRTK